MTLQVITLSGAIGLQSNSACLLGHLFLSHMSNRSSPLAGELLRLYTGGNNANASLVSSSAPQDFSYLPEQSVLRSVMTFLTEAGRKG